nr:UDP-glycosyltransferase [Paris polyphylla]
MDPLHVVALPYPGRGHINPMMVLCRLLADRGLLVTFVVTEEWLALLASSSPPPPPNVRLRAIPNVIPSESVRGADFIGFLEAVYTKMREPFERLLDRLEPPPVAIVADTYMPWAAAAAGRRGIPACSVFTMSAAFFSVLCQFDRIGDASEEADDPLEKYVPGLTSVRLSELHSIFAGMENPKKKAMEAISWARKAHCILFTSFYELEPCVIDALRSELSCPLYPVGPSIPYMMLQENPIKPLQHDDNPDYYEWLDSQPQCSVLYISLGSFLSVSALQMDEIAAGLMASGARFLWVARECSSRMQEMSSRAGLVLPWCDQLRVLCHPSIGGFLTHCGWNSTLEAVFSGVPMIVFPIFGIKLWMAGSW